MSRKARLFLLGILVGLTVQTGTLRSIDTVRRLQWTRSMWTNAPEVVDVWPDAGLPDSTGRLHAWWDVGQSLSFVPFDMLSVGVARAAGLSPASGGRVQRAVVSATYYPLVTGLCLVAAFWWLTAIGMRDTHATLGAIGLLFGTTLLYWTHDGQENSLMLLCALVASAGAAEFARTGRRTSAAASMAGLGYTALIRPQIFGVTALSVATSLAAFGHELRRLSPREKYRGAVASIAALSIFIAIERLVHYSRFHEWWGTYLGHVGPYIAAHPEYPPNFPLSLPFLTGFVGQTWSRFSVFFFEPLLLLPILIVIFRKSVSRPIVIVMAGLAATLAIDIAVHSKVQFWYGGNSWGPRYITVPAEMLAALAVAVLASIWSALSRVQRIAAAFLASAAVAIQLSSVLFDNSLELVQNVAGRPIVVQRLINIWHFVSTSDVSALGWRLYPSGTPHIALFPWVGRVFLAPGYATLTLAIWLCLVAATLQVTARLIRSATTR